MSVTITINGNQDFCRRNGLVEITDTPCCNLNVNDVPCECDPLHRLFEVFPLEINLANGNFVTVWSALGLEAQPYGEIDAQELLQAVTGTNPLLVSRAPKQLGENVFVCGLGDDYGARRLAELKGIAEEAIRRGELVVWG